MRRITLWLMSTIGALVLLFGYRTSTQPPHDEAVDASQARPAPAPSGSAPSGGKAEADEDDNADEGSNDDPDGSDEQETDGESGGDGGEESGESGESGTFEGALTQTAQGPVQVSITVAGGKFTDISVLTAPSGSGRHEEINSRALPILKSEALQKQSADLDTVSGATATSDGYRESLQAAIDAANL